MASYADVLAGGCFFGSHGWVEVEDAVTARVGGEAVEVVFRQVQAERKDLYEASG